MEMVLDQILMPGHKEHVVFLERVTYNEATCKTVQKVSLFFPRGEDWYAQFNIERTLEDGSVTTTVVRHARQGPTDRYKDFARFAKPFVGSSTVELMKKEHVPPEWLELMRAYFDRLGWRRATSLTSVIVLGGSYTLFISQLSGTVSAAIIFVISAVFATAANIYFRRPVRSVKRLPPASEGPYR